MKRLISALGRRAETAKRVAEVRTRRLRLVTITKKMLDAERVGAAALAKALRSRVTAEWPPEHWEPHVLEFIEKQVAEEPRTAGWHRYVLLPGGPGKKRVLVGCVGAFPKLEGDVEIGYSTLPEFQRRGYATEAAQALVRMLLRDKKVKSVSAQTFPRLPESIKVMERIGMKPAGDGDVAGTVRYRKSKG